MAWSYNKKPEHNDAWSIEEPTSKKRRVGEEEQVDDWGDDSLELTQAEMESLDVMASQALNASEVPDQFTSAGSFARPNNPVKTSTNKSSSSSDSSLRPKSFSSSSSASDASTNSLSSHSSINNGNVSRQSDKQSAVVAGFESELEKKNQEIRTALDQKYRSDGEVKFLRQTLEKKDAEVESLRAEKNAADNHQRQLQTEKEKNLKVQVDKLTSEAHFKEREYQERIQALEKKLKAKDEKLKQSCLGESSVSLSNEPGTSKTSSPVKIHVKPSPPSKVKPQRGDEALSSSQLHEFPTQSSFMEKPQGHSPSPKTSPVTRGTKLFSRQIESPDKSHSKRARMRRLQLTKARDQRSGAEIVSEMIRPCGTAANEGDPGLPGLLHAMSTSLTLDRLSYTRNKDSSFLSPMKPHRRSLLGSGQTVSADSASVVQIVSPENFHLAIQGLDMLLHDTRQLSGSTENTPLSFLKKRSPPAPTKAFDVSATRTSQSKGTTPPAGTVSSTQSSSPTVLLSGNDQPHSGALLLLPMLSDYLHHYLEMIHSTLAKGTAKSPATTPTSNSNQALFSGLDSISLHTGSSSYDSSLDSLSSCVLHLLQEGKVYATALEKYAISALQCLSLLIQLCPVVTSVLAHPSLAESKIAVANNDTSCSSTKSTVRSKSALKVESGTDADDEKSTSSSEIRVIRHATSSNLPQSLHNQSRLLLRVARIAGENLEESNASASVVEESLRVLNHLCHNCTAEEFLRLEHVVIKDALAATLKQTKHPQVLLQAQKLCGLLIHHPFLMSKLCTKTEICPLYNMYRLCVDPQVDKLHSISLQLYSEHVNILSSISRHKTGLSGLLSDSCACSNELVVGTILAMYKLLTAYNKHSSLTDPLLYSLLQGILVLHCLAQADKAFLQRHTPVQLSFVRLLSGLSSVIRPIRSKWEWYAAALDELCDFEPEFHDSSSQDSEGDERMDQT